MTYENLLACLSKASDWPTKSDLDAGLAVLPDNVAHAVRRTLRSYQHCVLCAPEGRGKTTLAKAFGYAALKDELVGPHLNDRDVIYFDVTDATTADIRELCAAITAFDHVPRLYLIENIHDADASDLDAVLKAAGAARNGRFLYTERSATGASMLEEQELRLNEAVSFDSRLVVRLDPSHELIAEIVVREYHARPRRRAAPTTADIEALSERCGGNLRALRAFLDAWDEGAVSALEEEQMLAKYWARLAARVPPPSMDCLLKLAAINQYSVSVAAGAAIAAEPLLTEHIISRHYMHGVAYYRLPHATDARLIINAWAGAFAQDARRATRNALLEYAAYLCTLHNANQLRVLCMRLRKEPSELRALLTAPATRDVLARSFAADYVAAPLTFAVNHFRHTAHVAEYNAQIVEVIVRAGPECLVSKMRSAEAVDTRECLKILQSHAPTFASTVRSRLSPEDWVDMYLRLSPNRFVRDILWRTSTAPPDDMAAKRGRLAVQRLQEQGGWESLVRGMSDEAVGKALVALRSIDPIAAADCAEAVSRVRDLSAFTRADQVTLLLQEVRKTGGPQAHRILVERAVECHEPAFYLGPEQGGAVSSLLFNLHWATAHGFSARDAEAYLGRILQTELSPYIRRWRPDSLYHFLWSAWLLAPTATRTWLRSGVASALAEVVARSNSADAFWILRNVWQIAEDVSAQVCGYSKAAATERFWSAGKVELQALPVLGVFLAHKLVDVGTLSLPDPADAGRAQLHEPSLTAIVFVLRCYEADPAALGTVMAQLGSVNLDEMLAGYPIEELRGSFENVISRARRLAAVQK